MLFAAATSLFFLSTLPTLCATHDNQLVFEPRHLYAVSSDARVSFADVPYQSSSLHPGHHERYAVDTSVITTYRPPYSVMPLQLIDERRRRRRTQQPLFVEQSFPDEHASWWDEDEVLGPDVSKRSVLQLLAKMTNNAYLNPGEAGWYDLGSNWTASYPIGWEPDDDGFRGHVFATPDNSTVVLSIKGTSGPWIGGGGPTTKKDKFNDNLLFSCCCAYVDWTWTTVCDCAKGGWKCDQDCLEHSLVEESLFYPIGINLYNNLTYMYPDSNIWLTGHSLGGAMAALLGVTFGTPVVAFESPGEKLASTRLHLPKPPSTQNIIHVYHTADPIAMGVCTGYASSCAVGGYAMETKCHLGRSIVYDTVSELGWRVYIQNHGIVPVIEIVLNGTWGPAEKEGREVPEAKFEEDCVECYQWEFNSLSLWT